MTTPMNVYKELAMQYGDINTDDPKAINRFFESDVYELPEETRLSIIDALFARMDEMPEPSQFIDMAEDEDVPPPNPANYQRADAKRRRARRNEPQYFIDAGTIAESIFANTFRDASEPGYRHAASRIMARITKSIRGFENKVFGGEEKTT